MSSCVECFFYSGLSGKTLQILSDREHPNFACEAETCSPYSPGPVANDEEIGFLVIDPTHFDAVRREITPDAFLELTNRDLSVLRVCHATKGEAEATREELIERGTKKTPPEIRSIEEVCVTRVERVRAAQVDGSRVLGVYDTALPDKRGHASIFTNEVGLMSGRKMRKQLREVCYTLFRDKIIPYDEFRRALP